MPSTSPDSPPPTVLVMEDEGLLRDVFVDRLADEYTVIPTDGGKSGLAALDHDVDVVLIDRRMPDLDGDTALRTLRERGFDCPVGVISAVEPSPDIVDLPFDLYLVKPVDLERLVDAVETLLDRATLPKPARECFAMASTVQVLDDYTTKSDWETDPALRELVSRFQDSLDRVDDEVRDRIDREFDGFPFERVSRIHE